MADFTREDLTGARFEEVDLTGARFRNVDLTGATIRGALLVNVDISGDIEDVRINGVDVVPPGGSRTRPSLPGPRQDAPGRRRRLPRGVGHPGAAVAADRGAGPPAGPRTCCTNGSTASGPSSRRCATSSSPPTPGSGAPSWGSRRPGTRWTCRTTRCPTSPPVPRDLGPPARRWTRSSPCAPTAWPPCARCSPAVTDAELARPDRTGHRARLPRAGELPRPPLPGRHPQRGMGTPPLRRTRPRHPRVPRNSQSRPSPRTRPPPAH